MLNTDNNLITDLQGKFEKVLPFLKDLEEAERRITELEPEGRSREYIHSIKTNRLGYFRKTKNAMNYLVKNDGDLRLRNLDLGFITKAYNSIRNCVVQRL